MKMIAPSLLASGRRSFLSQVLDFIAGNLMSQPDLRWKQRFKNFEKAVLLLDSALENDFNQLNQLEQEGVIQRFEYTFELAWKVLKDKMEYEGLLLDRISPKVVIKQAYTSKYIDNIETWIEMINDRHLMSHTYDSLKFQDILKTIASLYLPLLRNWYLCLRTEIENEDKSDT